MEYNPLTALVDSGNEKLGELRNKASELTLQLAWHATFDAAAASTRAVEEEATAANAAAQVMDLDDEIARAKQRVEDVRPVTRLGWNPYYWFSETRSTAMSEIAQRKAQITERQTAQREYRKDQERSLTRLDNIRDSLERYSKFDRGTAKETLNALESDIWRTGAEVDRWTARAHSLDEALEAPLRELLSVRSRLQVLKSDVGEANRFEQKLNRAGNSYERKQVHDECKSRLGSGSPKEIINTSERAIAALERTIQKLERRLEEIARRGTMDVRSLIIDGSNLCYEADELIGLFALRALCERLANDFEVIVVFDASIMDKLGLLSSDKLRSELPTVKVHVVTSETGADETILDVAQDPDTFVVSNDRFADFSKKPVVRDGRLIRHEIINGRIFIHDLSIDVSFSNKR